MPQTIQQPKAQELDWFEPEDRDITSYHDIKDDTVGEYRGYQILLDVPNGGILGITIARGEEVWIVCTESFERFLDVPWHIQQAKRKIDELHTTPGQIALEFRWDS